VSFTGPVRFLRCMPFGHPPWLELVGGGPARNRKPGLAFKAQGSGVSSRLEAGGGHTAVVGLLRSHGLRRPNRCTTVQPGRHQEACSPAPARLAPSQGGSACHPASPSAKKRFRCPGLPRLRLTRSCQANRTKDTTVALLDKSFDSTLHRMAVEIPTEVSWGTSLAPMRGINKLLRPGPSSTSYMQVQTHTRPTNTSDVEFRRTKSRPLAEAIHQAIVAAKGYIQQPCWPASMPRQTFPRLRLKPIDSGHLQPP